MTAILQIRNITKEFGGLTALNDVSFNVEPGRIFGLIGPNGAGKSTMFKIIAGFHEPTSGSVIFNGQNITGLKPNRIAAIGVVRTFQETTLFQELAVFDNALIGTHNSAATDVVSALLRLDRQKQEAAAKHANDVLNVMGLSKRRNQLAGELPLGSKRALAIAVALAAKPQVLLLDEPFAGMNAEETNHMMSLTRKVCESGITIVLVEHDMRAVMGLCDHLTVLNFGTVLASGTPGQVRNNPDVVNAYLGGGGSP